MTISKNLSPGDTVIVPLSRFAFVKTKFKNEVKPMKPTEFIDLVENIASPNRNNHMDNDSELNNSHDSLNGNTAGNTSANMSEKDNVKEEEIREIHGSDDFHFQLKTICKKIVETKIEVKTTTRPISKEDEELLRRIREMEEEEEKGISSSAREYPLETVKCKSIPTRTPSQTKQVKFDQSAIEKDEMKVKEAAAKSKSKKPEPQVIMKNKVVERSFDSDDSDYSNNSEKSNDSDAIERELIERDIAIAYHQKRQQLLASGLLTSQSNEMEEEWND